MNAYSLCDRQDLTEEERELFLTDVKTVCSEYFDGDFKYSIDVTRTEKGFSVCIVFDASRIKNFKRPK